MRRATYLFLLAGALSCGGSLSGPGDGREQRTQTTRSDTVTIALGESVRIDPAGLVVLFDAVLGDSRCPPRAMCVWAGSVRVRLLTGENAGGGAAIELESNLEPRSAHVGQYRLTLLPEVKPEKGEPGAYTIRLEVARE